MLYVRLVGLLKESVFSRFADQTCEPRSGLSVLALCNKVYCNWIRKIRLQFEYFTPASTRVRVSQIQCACSVIWREGSLCRCDIDRPSPVPSCCNSNYSTANRFSSRTKPATVPSSPPSVTTFMPLTFSIHYYYYYYYYYCRGVGYSGRKY